MITPVLTTPSDMETEEGHGPRHKIAPYTSSYPLMVGGKAVLKGNQAAYRLRVFGGKFSRRLLCDAAESCARQCYPEAQDIHVSFDVDGALVIDWRVNRRHEDFRESRYEVDHADRPY